MIEELTEEIEFEGDDFAESCLKKFDEAVAKIEADISSITTSCILPTSGIQDSQKNI